MVPSLSLHGLSVAYSRLLHPYRSARGTSYERDTKGANHGPTFSILHHPRDGMRSEGECWPPFTSFPSLPYLIPFPSHPSGRRYAGGAEPDGMGWGRDEWGRGKDGERRPKRDGTEWEETREWGELMPRERSKGNIIQPLGRECSCRSASPFSLLSSSLPVSSPPYHPARTGPFGPRRVSGEKWGRSTSQRKERYGHWAASVSPKFRSFRSSIAPLPRQSSPLPFTTFMSLRLSDGSVAYGTSEERMNVGKRRCQLPACTVRLLFGSCVTSRHPHSSLTHIVVTFSLPHPTRDRSERGEKWQGEGP